MTDEDMSILNLKLKAASTAETALVAYYTEKNFHKERLAIEVEALEEAIADYRAYFPKGGDA